MQLSLSPQMITVMVAHCGVFDEGMCPQVLKFLSLWLYLDGENYEDLHVGAWHKSTGRDFLRFWSDAGIEDQDVLRWLGAVPMFSQKAE